MIFHIPFLELFMKNLKPFSALNLLYQLTYLLVVISHIDSTYESFLAILEQKCII